MINEQTQCANQGPFSAAFIWLLCPDLLIYLFAEHPAVFQRGTRHNKDKNPALLRERSDPLGGFPSLQERLLELLPAFQRNMSGDAEARCTFLGLLSECKFEQRQYKGSNCAEQARAEPTR